MLIPFFWYRYEKRRESDVPDAEIFTHRNSVNAGTSFQRDILEKKQNDYFDYILHK
jgi:hypothetical protein